MMYNAEVQEAFQQHLNEHQDSMLKFATAVATLCERGTPGVASTLHGLRGGNQLVLHTPHERVATRQPITPRISAKAPVALSSDFATNSRSTSSSSDAGIQDNGILDIHDDVFKDAYIRKLPFINEAGRIDQPIPLFARLMGKKYEDVREFCLSLIAGWNPVDNVWFRFIKSKVFQMFSACVIILNYFYIMAQSDYKVSNIGEENSNTLVTIGYCFTTFYVVELISNMIAYGKFFFIGPEYGWNLFDFAIVMVSVFEIIVEVVGSGTPINTSFLRIIRFLRISRVLRMFSAMRMFKEIKVMVDCLAGSLGIFFFCSGMLAMFLSLFAVFFVQGLAAYLVENPGLDPEEEEILREQFGSVSASVLSLFVCATGGDDWRNYYDVIKTIGVQYDWLFLIFVLFYTLAFVNVIMGVFCEKACNLAAPTVSELMVCRHEKELTDANELFDLLYREMKDPDSGTIDAAKFEDFVHHPEVEQFFEVRGLKASSARRFFYMLCGIQQTDFVDFATFVSACVRLDGMASGIDAHVLSVRQMYALHNLKAVASEQHKEMQLNTKAMHEDMARFHNSFSNASQADGTGSVQVVKASVMQEAFPKAGMDRQVASPLESELHGLILKLKEEMTCRQQTLPKPILAQSGQSTAMPGEAKLVQLVAADGTPQVFGDSPEELARRHAQEVAQKAALEEKLIASEANAEALQQQLVKLQSFQNRSREDSTKLSMDAEGHRRQVAALEQHVSAQDKREAELLAQLVARREADMAKTDDHQELQKQVDHHKASEDHLRKVLAIQEMELRELRQSQKGAKASSGGIMDFITCGNARDKAVPTRPALAPADGYDSPPYAFNQLALRDSSREAASRDSSRGHPLQSHLPPAPYHDASRFGESPLRTPNNQYTV
jgi:hypothetical protein